MLREYISHLSRESKRRTHLLETKALISLKVITSGEGLNLVPTNSLRLVSLTVGKSTHKTSRDKEIALRLRLGLPVNHQARVNNNNFWQLKMLIK